MDVQFYKTKTIELYAFEKNTVMIYIYIFHYSTYRYFVEA